MVYNEIKNCRLCKTNDLVSVLDLGNQFLTGVFPRKGDSTHSGPVELVKCMGECGLVQLRQTYSHDLMYGDGYGYKSSLNTSMVNHLRDKVRKIERNFELDDEDYVLDIGCNDGTTLLQYENKNLNLVGIDPVSVKFNISKNSNLQLIDDFFSSEVIENKVGLKKFKVVTSFSMFYDLEDPIDFSQQVASILDDEGVWVFEQSYLPSMLNKYSFDTICHEHLEYYSIKQVEYILTRSNLKILDIEFNNVNGGSFSVSCALKHSSLQPKTSKLNTLLEYESEEKLDSLETFENFTNNVNRQRDKLLHLLQNYKKQGIKVCGLGASTKGNVLLQYYGLNTDLIEYIGEVNQDKFGCITPGSGIEIKDESDLLDNYDTFLVLPWHFRDFFVNSKRYQSKDLIFPLPILSKFYC